MPRLATLCNALATLAGLACAGPLLAAAITVSPTRIELSAQRPVATLEVRNEGNESVTMQLERTAWTQEGGVDVYSSSAALIATPSVFELAPHGRQVLRVALRDGSPRTEERAYRLYADEVSVSELASSGLRMALRIGIPVFAVPAAGAPRLNASVDARADGGAVISLRNDGSHFTRAIRVQATDSSGAVMWQSPSPAYLLARGEHRYLVDDGAAPLLRNPVLQLSIVTETGVERIEAQRRP
jgi:fimbrial chaperone protein